MNWLDGLVYYVICFGIASIIILEELILIFIGLLAGFAEWLEKKIGIRKAAGVLLLLILSLVVILFYTGLLHF